MKLEIAFSLEEYRLELKSVNPNNDNNRPGSVFAKPSAWRANSANESLDDVELEGLGLDEVGLRGASASNRSCLTLSIFKGNFSMLI
jgi:hypothetical protein